MPFTDVTSVRSKACVFLPNCVQLPSTKFVNASHRNGGSEILSAQNGHPNVDCNAPFHVGNCYLWFCASLPPASSILPRSTNERLALWIYPKHICIEDSNSCKRCINSYCTLRAFFCIDQSNLPLTTAFIHLQGLCSRMDSAWIFAALEVLDPCDT
jgi:hypothetical protein